MRPRPFVLLLASLLACDATGPDITLVVATDQAAYSLAPDSVLAAVSFSLTNAGPAPLEVPRCGPYVSAYIDRLDASQWRQVGQRGTICPAIYDMTPLRLAPGETAQAAALLLAAGAYRLRVPHAIVGHPTDVRVARSNEFAIAPRP